MRTITLAVTPNSPFDVPISTGYSVYGALLSLIYNENPDVSEHIHDINFSSLHNSGLIGPTRDEKEDYDYSNKENHKKIREECTYTIKLGITEPDDETLFDTLATAFALSGNELTLTNGELTIEEFNSNSTTHADLLNDQSDARSVSLTFETVTGIYQEDVTTAFPGREDVFRSLCQKWNYTAPEEHQIKLQRYKLREALIEKPAYSHNPQMVEGHGENDPLPLRTESAVTQLEHIDGGKYTHHIQGFIGTCEYQFKQAPDEFKRKIVALAKFAQYSGVGSSVSRGCGTTTASTNTY